MKGAVISQAVESSRAAPRQQLELLRYGVNVSISARGRRNKNCCNGILKACKAGMLKREKLQQKTAHEQPPQSSLLVQNMLCTRNAVLPTAFPLCNSPKANPVIQAAPDCSRGSSTGPCLPAGRRLLCCPQPTALHCSAQKHCGLLKCCSHLA